MAKKIKKQARKVSAVTSTVEIPVRATESSSLSGIGNRTYSSDFNPDYSETIKDLKRIGLLAGTFFTVLVIISFFLR